MRLSNDKVTYSSILAMMIFCSVSIVYFYSAIKRSETTYFWMDEVLAVSTARLGSMPEIWTAIWRGAEFSPPTYDLLLHTLPTNLAGGRALLVARLPSILAVYGAGLCSLMLLRSYVRPFAGLLGFGIILNFGLFVFAVQARQYGLLSFGLAAALLLWDRVGRSHFAVIGSALLWFLLSMCVSLHFYGVLVVGVIGLAELLWFISKGQFRWNVWLPIVLVVPVVAAWFPLERHLSLMNMFDNRATNYYGKPTINTFLSSLFDLVVGGQKGSILLLMAISFLALSGLAKRVAWGRKSPAREQEDFLPPGLSRIEIIMISLCVLPFAGFGIAVFLTGSFSTRYISGAALLPGLAGAYIVSGYTQRETLALFLIPFILVFAIENRKSNDPLPAVLQVIQSTPRDLPIVVPEGLLYIELMEAAPKPMRLRLIYLLKPPGLISPDPTNEHQIERLAAMRIDYTVMKQGDFLAKNKDFYLIYRPNASTDTTTPSLINQGKLDKLVRIIGDVFLFEGSQD